MAAAHLDADWPAFEEPALLPLKGARVAILAARATAFAWSIGVVVFALRARAGDDIDDSSVGGLAWLGPAVAGLIALTGWFWSDRVTSNVHRLGGRLPTRARCVSAWALPLAWAGLLWLTVLRMEPTEVFDVRPMIVLVLIALSVWRPYSLVRRILATLSRMRSDALIGSGYVFDLSTFGLLWWQLASWSSDAGRVDPGQADVLLGVSAAAAVGFGLNVVVWVLLTADVERAEADRLLALRTRHDHRHLRLRGINPMDPEVRWALLRIRQEEELERRAAEEQQRERRNAPVPSVAEDWRPDRPPPEPVTIDPLDVAPDPVAPDTDQPAAAAPETTAAEWARPAELEEEAADGAPPDEVTPLVAEILDGDTSDQIIADLVGEIATTETSAQILADLVDEVASEKLPGIGVEPVERERASDADAVPEPAESEPSSEIAARLRERLTASRDARAAKRSHSTVQPVESEAPVSRLARRLDMAGADSTTSRRELSAAKFASDDPDSGSDITSRRDRFAQRLNVSERDTRSQRTLLARLEEYGITPRTIEGEPLVPLADEFRHDEERWIPPRLYELEAVRYLLLIGIVVITVTSAWIVTRTVSAGGELVDGEIVPADLNRINVARRAFVTSLSVTLVLVALWCAVFVSHARRAGAPDTREWRTYSLLGLTVALNVFSFVADGGTRGTTSLACVMGCLLAVLIAVALVSPIARWFERRTIGLVLWTAGLAFVAIISWLGGLQRPIEATDALEAVTFVAALQAIAAGVVVVVAALSTSDLEDAIRLSPAMAEPIPAPPNH